MTLGTSYLSLARLYISPVPLPRTPSISLFGVTVLSDVDNLNGFIEEDPSLEDLNLWKIMMKSDGGLFNNAAQVKTELNGVERHRK